jgi:ELMO domain-containing protein
VIKKAGHKGENQDFTRYSFFERLKSCFVNPSLASMELEIERDFVMALARHKIDYSGEDRVMHEQILKALYIKLIDGAYRGTIGKHWEEIGFQGSDPRTDIRGAGLLGLL